MFGRIINVCKNAQKLDRSKILQDIFRNSSIQQEIADLNKSQMYDEGVDSLGKSLGEYAPVTITHWKPLAAKEGRDGRVDHVTLKDSGEFYDSIKVENERDQIVITGDLEKIIPTNNINSEDALGLTKKSLQKVRGWVLPDFRTRTLSQILK